MSSDRFFNWTLRCVTSVCCALAIAASAGRAQAATLRVSTPAPIIVTAPSGWKIANDRPPTKDFPFETFRIYAADGRNAVCMISVIGKDNEKFGDKDFLRKLLTAQGRAFKHGISEIADAEVHELKVEGGQAFYADFIDPSRADKPVKKGDYKGATPVAVGLGTKFLIQVTILTDEIDGEDYRELMKIVKSIRVMNLI